MDQQASSSSSSPRITRLEQLLAKYEISETLGTGAFSEVKRCTDKRTGQQFAMKIIDKAKCKGKESMIETEVCILKTAKHENIIQLYEMYEIEGKIYLIMELVTGGELFDEIVRIGKYSEPEAAKIVHKILVAIEYLHQLGIAHRDLKPENLLLSDRTKNAKIMISDFGLSKIFNDDEVMKTACGTPGYVAPEVLVRKGYGREVDLWSLGVITYILLSGYPPFYDQNNVELFKQIMAGKYEFDRPWWDNISEKAKNFIRHLLVLDPKVRYTAEQALAHPFIVDHCGRTSVSSVSVRRELIPMIKAPVTVASAAQSSSSRPPTSPLPTPINTAAPKVHAPGPATPRSSDGGRPIGTEEDGSPYSSHDSVSDNPKREGSVSASWNNIAAQSPRTSLVLKPGPKKVRMLTYNIFLRPPGIKNNLSDHKNARHAIFGENYLKSFDIVALQEMFSYGSSRLSRMVHFAKKYGFEYYVSSPSRSVFNAQVDGGLMIMSKYPIVRTDKMTFKRGVHSDRFSAKGAIYAKIALTSNFSVHVFTTHLQSTNDRYPSLMDPSVTARLRQVTMLKEFIDECTRNKAPHEPIILLGDMNTNARMRSTEHGKESSEEYQMLKKILKGDVLKSPSNEAGPSPPQSPTSSNTSVAEPIRYKINDLAYDAYGHHPITYGDVVEGTKTPKETVLTLPEDLGTACCLDYIFWMNAATQPDLGQQNAGYKIEKNSTSIQRFLVEGAPFTQISDHYGVATDLLIL